LRLHDGRQLFIVDLLRGVVLDGRGGSVVHVGLLR
jgi:hypothetical protein